jgi:hypothetical protein
MYNDIIIVNNFYEDPDSIRELALNMGVYPFVGGYPGQRSLGVPKELSLQLKSKFEEILGMTITRWETYAGEPGADYYMNTSFQLITDGNQNWVHKDASDWAAVVYLNPDTNPDSGTGLFTHIETGVSQWIDDDPATHLYKTHRDDLYDPSKWRCNLEVKNQYNRMILYKGSYYHRSMIPGFGRNYLEGRLTQVFFFNSVN